MKIRESTLTHYVNYGDFEEAIKAVYSLPTFDILESPNDTDYIFDVEKKPLDNYKIKELTESLAQGGVSTYRIGTILQDMCNKDLIEPGIYCIEVCW